MTEKQLKDILKKHPDWLAGTGKGKQANLSGANLSESVYDAVNLDKASFDFVHVWTGTRWEKTDRGLVLARWENRKNTNSFNYKMKDILK